MKANRASPLPLLALAAALAVFTAACSSQREIIPAPRPIATPRPLPSPPPPAAPRVTDWHDALATPGNWRWGMEGRNSVARFGGDALVLSCNRDAAAITLIRPGAGVASGAGGVPFTILTSSGNRTLSGQELAGPPPVIALTLPARDGVLDAMAFSRGRFAVETAGLPTLYVPSWPEISRVIEDCR